MGAAWVSKLEHLCREKLSRLAVFLFVVAIIFAISCLAANRFGSRHKVFVYAVAIELSMILALLIATSTIKPVVKRNVVGRNLKSSETFGAGTKINAHPRPLVFSSNTDPIQIFAPTRQAH